MTKGPYYKYSKQTRKDIFPTISKSLMFYHNLTISQTIKKIKIKTKIKGKKRNNISKIIKILPP